jgi:predicted outer membrane repeat protein
MNLKDRARAGGRQRLRLMAAGVAAGTGLALMVGPSALAASTTYVGCSVASLTAAVSGAQSGAVLSLASRCTYVLSGRLNIPVSLTIKGNGDTITAGTPGFTLLSDNPGAPVTLHDLTLSNSGAAAIVNLGTLTVTDSTFTGNAGAISNSGTLTVSYDTFTGNAGGIGNSNTASVDDSTFTGNTGAISNSGTLTVSYSTFTGNTGAIGNSNAASVDESDFNRNTGAISNLGFTNAVVATLTVTDSDFTGNTSTGAIYSTADTRTLGATAFEANIIVTDSDFRNNSSSSPSGGGAIFSGNSEGTLDNDWFTGNTATYSGGAVSNGCHNENSNEVCGTLVIDDGSMFSDNTAAEGGAIFGGGTLTLTDSSLTYNSATDPTIGYGGGLYGSGTISYTQITDNTASVDGGGIYGAPTLSHTEVRYNEPDNCAPAGTIAGCTN